MDSDIEFGDLEQTAPERKRRPDRDRHYAVAPVGNPAETGLPIYVDMDVMIEMEEHAGSDTSVELGGVLLGGRHDDEQGRPFVLVADSLRAKHYRSSKGSFQFTHDTWTEIMRQREAFSDELQMVGWYHTHPGWGVFLSGLDTFICDHFFNKPLDVALVIDPCRGDRGFFQWTGGDGRRLRRSDGFYLISSRLRRDELESCAAQLEGRFVMQTAPTHRAAFPAPVVNIAEQRPGWLGAAVLGTLLVQVCLLLLLGWRMIGPEPAAAGGVADQSAELARLTERIEELEQSQASATRLKIEREVLDRVLDQLQVGPEGLVKSLQDEREENVKLRDRLRNMETGNNAVCRENERLQASLARAEKEQKTLRDRIAGLQGDLAERNNEIDDLKGDLAGLKPPAEPNSGGNILAGWRSWLSSWWGITIMVVAAVAVVAAVVAALVSKSNGADDKDDDPPGGEDLVWPRADKRARIDEKDDDPLGGEDVE